jgi:RNA polymerase sigma-70 factor (ECF subfamily)
MTGSVADGEDIVQDTLARAYYALSELPQMPALRPWLFKIAHRRAIDYLRGYERRMGEPLDDQEDTRMDDTNDPEDLLAREQAVYAAVSRFVELAPAQRSCVILKDVLGHSLEDISTLLDISVPAVKAALHRGRERLRDASPASREAAARHAASLTIARYAALFNARDWDGVRAMLSDDVRLELISRSQRAGRREVGVYFSNYERIADWHLVPGWMEGREMLAVFRHVADARPAYFILLTVQDGQITLIRDFRYVPYISDEAPIEFH